MSGGAGSGRGGAEGPRRGRGGPGAIYSGLVGIVFVAIVAVAAINMVETEEGGVIGASEGEAGRPLARFAVPALGGGLDGDANVAQDDCEVARIPCPEPERRTPACEVELRGAIRVCDLFARPLVISFWFTRGGECELQQDAFEAVYRSRRDAVNFLAINVRDERSEVARLARERGWTHPIGLDPDGALSNLYRVGGCPTFLYAYSGGILRESSIGELSAVELRRRVDALVAASEERAATVR